MAYPFLLATLLTLYVRPGDLSPALAGLPILNILAALIGVSLVLAWTARTSRPVWTPQLNWMLGVWFAFVFSHAVHLYFAATETTFKDFFTNIFVVLATVFTLTSFNRIRGFATLWIFLSLFLAIDGIQQSYTGVGVGGQPLLEGRIQGVGIFSDPNDLALAFLIAMPLSHARFANRGLFSRVFFLFLAAVFTYATILTNSRGGMLSLLLVFFALSYHRFGPKLGVFIGTLLVLALLALGPSRMNAVNSKEASAQGRIVAWSEGLQMFKRNPLAGVGYGMFTEHHELTAHNSFVLCFAETGFVGAFFWVGLLYVSILGLRKIVAAARGDPPDPELAAWAKDTQIAFLGFLAGAFFLSRTYNVVLYLLVGFAAALYAVARRQRPELEFTVRMRDRWSVAGLVVGGIALTYVLVKTLAVWTGRFY